MDDLKVLADSLKGWIARPENRHHVRRVAWIIAVVAVLFLSAVSIWGGHLVTGFYKPGIVVAVVYWAGLFGITASLVLPNKAVVATFGGL